MSFHPIPVKVMDQMLLQPQQHHMASRMSPPDGSTRSRPLLPHSAQPRRPRVGSSTLQLPSNYAVQLTSPPQLTPEDCVPSQVQRAVPAEHTFGGFSVDRDTERLEAELVREIDAVPIHQLTTISPLGWENLLEGQQPCMAICKGSVNGNGSLGKAFAHEQSSSATGTLTFVAQPVRQSSSVATLIKPSTALSSRANLLSLPKVELCEPSTGTSTSTKPVVKVVGPCKICIPGSGNLEGHRGRHLRSKRCEVILNADGTKKRKISKCSKCGATLKGHVCPFRVKGGKSSSKKGGATKRKPTSAVPVSVFAPSASATAVSVTSSTAAPVVITVAARPTAKPAGTAFATATARLTSAKAIVNAVATRVPKTCEVIPKRKRKKKNKSKMRPFLPPELECKKCCPNSGNRAGHRGRHATRPAMPLKDRTMFCRTCVPGTTNMEGHKGRCSTKLDTKLARKRKQSGANQRKRARSTARTRSQRAAR